MDSLVQDLVHWHEIALGGVLGGSARTVHFLAEERAKADLEELQEDMEGAFDSDNSSQSWCSDDG